MSKRSPKFVEEKLEIVQRLLNHEKSVSQLSELYGVSESAINSWKMKYEKKILSIIMCKHSSRVEEC